MRHRDPVAVAFDLVVICTGCAALRVIEIGGVDGGDIAVGIFVATGTFDDVAVTQAHLVARIQAVETLGRDFGEVFAFDPQLA